MNPTITRIFVSALAQTQQPTAPLWPRLGPGYQPGNGTCYHVLRYPQRVDGILLGARPGGLMLTTHGGNTWLQTSRRVNPSMPNQESLARAPSQSDKHYRRRTAGTDLPQRFA